MTLQEVTRMIYGRVQVQDDTPHNRLARRSCWPADLFVWVFFYHARDCAPHTKVGTDVDAFFILVRQFSTPVPEVLVVYWSPGVEDVMATDWSLVVE
jgi:hypothetical protein